MSAEPPRALPAVRTGAAAQPFESPEEAALVGRLQAALSSLVPATPAAPVQVAAAPVRAAAAPATPAQAPAAVPSLLASPGPPGLAPLAPLPPLVIGPPGGVSGPPGGLLGPLAGAPAAAFPRPRAPRPPAAPAPAAPAAPRPVPSAPPPPAGTRIPPPPPARRLPAAPARPLPLPPPTRPTFHTDERRDWAQRLGDRLYTLVTRIRNSDRSGAWILLVVLFGLTVPAVILRSRVPLHLRVVASGAIFVFWVALINGLLLE